MTEQINALAGVAREAGDYTSEQFMQWFIKEQVEEVATMSDLLRVAERSGTTRWRSRTTSPASRPARRARTRPRRAAAGAGA